MTNVVKMVGTSVVAGAGAYDQGVAEMNRVLRQVESTVDALAASWRGEPQRAYQLLKEKWRASAAELAKSGTEVSAKMNDSVRSMQQSEDELESMIRSLTR